MPITRQQIQERRTPKALQQFAEEVRFAVRADQSEFESGMKRRGLYKEFLDEIEPLSQFAMLAYPDTHMVEPVLGNQGYDAVVYGADGQVVDRIELTVPFDGGALAEDVREALKYGISTARVGKPGDDLEELIPIIKRTCHGKAQKDYSDATLVFVITALPPFPRFEARYEQQLQHIKTTLASVSYRAKRVFMFVPPLRLERVDA